MSLPHRFLLLPILILLGPAPALARSNYVPKEGDILFQTSLSS